MQRRLAVAVVVVRPSPVLPAAVLVQLYGALALHIVTRPSTRHVSTAGGAMGIGLHSHSTASQFGAQRGAPHLAVPAVHDGNPRESGQDRRREGKRTATPRRGQHAVSE